MTSLFVLYSGAEDARFDRDYYVASHLPKARAAWEAHGLESVTAFFPEGGGDTAAIAVCRFRDAAALAASLNSPDTGHVLADIENFTDLQPTLLQGSALGEA